MCFTTFQTIYTIDCQFDYKIIYWLVGNQLINLFNYQFINHQTEYQLIDCQIKY